MHNPEVTGRMLKWATELGQFDLEYMSRTAIKGQSVGRFYFGISPRHGRIRQGNRRSKPEGTSQPIPSRRRNIRVMMDNVCGWGQ